MGLTYDGWNPPIGDWMYNPGTGDYIDREGKVIANDLVLRKNAEANPRKQDAEGVNRFEYSEGSLADFPLPTRFTKGSAGYDIFSPVGFDVPPKGYAEVGLGIRCRVKDGEFLLILPRSSMGFGGNHVALSNTAGVIDSDYYGNPTNGGEMRIRLFNASDSPYRVKKGDRVAQAIFLRFDVVDGDEARGCRVGGFGSTGKN